MSRHIALAVVSEWLQSLEIDAPQEIARELSKCSKLYSSLRTLESLPAPAQPPEPWSLDDARSEYFSRLLQDVNECFYREERGKLFLGFSGELFMYNEVAKRAADKIRTASEVELMICTRGGSGEGANIIVQALADASARGVQSTATVYHLGLSAGAVILQGATHRRMTADSHLMIHSPAMFCAGTADELRKKADEVEKAREEDVQLFWKRTGLPKTIVRKWFDGKSHYFNAETAKHFNLIDEIVPPCAAPSRSDKTDPL